ncbi:MAG: aldo/keto reductase [Alphaproteobacteria bacterium]|nr:aldo/keto reductase [Alphaproteobacteria bacterium]
MEYRNLGHSGLKVSPICLGAMMFGDRTGQNEAAHIVAHARESGINFIDTADVYAKGESERVLGHVLAGERDHWVLATKLCNAMGDGPNERGLSRGWMMRAAEASLERLATDRIDLYYLHKFDAETPLEETVGAMGDLIRAGKVRYWGVSNFRGWQIARICELADRLGVPRPIASQPYYNAMDRSGENEILPAAAAYGLGNVTYSPLSRGVLTGKYDPAAPPPPDTRAGRNDKRIMQTEFRKDSLLLAQEIKRHAETRGMTAGQFALNWVLNNRLVTAVLAGPRTIEQWTEYAAALGKGFGAEDEALIERLVPKGHPSTHGYSDPAYPITGRAPRKG